MDDKWEKAMQVMEMKLNWRMLNCPVSDRELRKHLFEKGENKRRESLFPNFFYEDNAKEYFQSRKFKRSDFIKFADEYDEVFNTDKAGDVHEVADEQVDVPEELADIPEEADNCTEEPIRVPKRKTKVLEKPAKASRKSGAVSEKPVKNVENTTKVVKSTKVLEKPAKASRKSGAVSEKPAKNVEKPAKSARASQKPPVLEKSESPPMIPRSVSERPKRGFQRSIPTKRAASIIASSEESFADSTIVGPYQLRPRKNIKYY